MRKPGLSKHPGFSFFVGKGDVYGFENDHSAVPGSVYFGGTGIFVCPQPEKVRKKGALQMRERFEQRLFRIFAQAGYSPVQLLTVTPEEMVEIPGITVPNIRAVLCVQNKVLADRNKVRSGRLVEELLKEAGESRCCHE